MNILVLSSEYREAGGEEISTLEEVKLLRKNGHTVRHLSRRSTEAKDRTLALEALGYSSAPIQAIEAEFAKQNFDVIYCQNLHTRFGPETLNKLHRFNTPIVAAMRNYRTWCPAGVAFRGHEVCTDCMGTKYAHPCFFNKCYHGKLGSLLAAWSTRSYDWTQVTRFIAVSNFVKNTLHTAGIAPLDKISVKPNCVEDSKVGTGSGGYALFVGDPENSRPEKGYDLLHAAWTKANFTSHNIRIAHGMPHNRVLDLMGDAAFVVVPSIWWEPFGRVVVEAYSKGTPVLAFNLGGLTEIIQHNITGWLVDPGVDNNSAIRALSEGLKLAFSQASTLRHNARAAYEANYTPQRNHDDFLLPIFGQTIREFKVRG